MKTKTKMLAMVEIVIVLCSLFLVAIPAIAAEQNQETQEVSAAEVTTASEDDYVLGVYGNANEDDTIDMRDLTYVKLIFFGKKPETELADAKYDGKINPLDFIQIKLIIVGKEKELTVVDSIDRIVTVNKPIERVVACYKENVEMMRSLKTADKIVCVTDYVIKMEVFFPEFAGYPYVIEYSDIDIEKILELQPDIVITALYPARTKDLQDKLDSANANIAVVNYDCYKPQSYVEEVEALGYIFDKKEEAKKLIDFYEECMDTIKERVEGLSDADKPKVYFEYWRKYFASGGGGYNQMIVAAGGNNIFSGLPGDSFIDAEEVIKQNPEIIIGAPYPLAAGYSLDVGDITEMKEAREEVMNRPELQEVRAVKNGKVYIMTCSHGITSARHFVTIAYFAKWFHPDLFKDFDPVAIHQEYLTEFQEIDIDLDKHGVFVYHPDEHPDGQ